MWHALIRIAGLLVGVSVLAVAVVGAVIYDEPMMLGGVIGGFASGWLLGITGLWSAEKK